MPMSFRGQFHGKQLAMSRQDDTRFFRQSKSDEFSGKAPGADRDDDELAATSHVGHRQAGLVRRKFHLVNGLAGFLVERTEFIATSAWSGRKQPGAVS